MVRNSTNVLPDTTLELQLCGGVWIVLYATALVLLCYALIIERRIRTRRKRPCWLNLRHHVRLMLCAFCLLEIAYGILVAKGVDMRSLDGGGGGRRASRVLDKLRFWTFEVAFCLFWIFWVDYLKLTFGTFRKWITITLSLVILVQSVFSLTFVCLILATPFGPTLQLWDEIVWVYLVQPVTMVCCLTFLLAALRLFIALRKSQRLGTAHTLPLITRQANVTLKLIFIILLSTAGIVVQSIAGFRASLDSTDRKGSMDDLLWAFLSDWFPLYTRLWVMAILTRRNSPKALISEPGVVAKWWVCHTLCCGCRCCPDESRTNNNHVNPTGPNQPEFEDDERGRHAPGPGMTVTTTTPLFDPELEGMLTAALLSNRMTNESGDATSTDGAQRTTVTINSGSTLRARLTFLASPLLSPPSNMASRPMEYDVEDDMEDGVRPGMAKRRGSSFIAPARLEVEDVYNSDSEEEATEMKELVKIKKEKDKDNDDHDQSANGKEEKQQEK